MRLPKGVTLINMACSEEVLEAEMPEVLSARTDLCYISDVPPENTEEVKARCRQTRLHTAVLAAHLR